MRDQGRGRWLAVGLAAFLAAVATAVATGPPPERAPRPFMRPHLNPHAEAVAEVRAENGKEASGEDSGPAQEQVSDRALPRGYVSSARAEAARSAFRALRTAHRVDRAAVTGPWQELGPITPAVPGEVTFTGAPTTNSGRITAMAVAPSCGQPGQGCRLWIAAAGGGVWRTDDALAATVAWMPVSSGLTSNAIGSLAIDPADPSGSTLYAGTGEPNGSGDSEAGVGLFKSSDRGDHWSLVPASVPVARDRSIGAIAIDPAQRVVRESCGAAP